MAIFQGMLLKVQFQHLVATATNLNATNLNGSSKLSVQF